MASTSSTSSAAGEGAAVLQALSDELAGAVERAGRAVVAIHARRRIPSSGVLWEPTLVVGASHTIRRDEGITVTLADGSSVPARLAGRDPGTDLALLRLESPAADGSAAPAQRGGADDLRVGQLVLALGRPGREVTASLGAISAVGGEWRTWQGGRIDRLVRLDLAIYDGFSGGPLVDARGRVLGINTSGLSRSAALTIPLSTVERVAAELAARGRVARGYLGVGMQPVRMPAALVRRHGLPGDVGLMVVSVEPGGPADAAGLLLGDVLVTFDGEPVTDASDVLAALGGGRIGEQVKARVVRAGELVDVSVKVGERS